MFNYRDAFTIYNLKQTYNYEPDLMCRCRIEGVLHVVYASLIEFVFNRRILRNFQVVEDMATNGNPVHIDDAIEKLKKLLR